jgi:hypothetical protein
MSDAHFRKCHPNPLPFGRGLLFRNCHVRAQVCSWVGWNPRGNSRRGGDCSFFRRSKCQQLEKKSAANSAASCAASREMPALRLALRLRVASSKRFGKQTFVNTEEQTRPARYELFWLHSVVSCSNCICQIAPSGSAASSGITSMQIGLESPHSGWLDESNAPGYAASRHRMRERTRPRGRSRRSCR